MGFSGEGESCGGNSREVYVVVRLFIWFLVVSFGWLWGFIFVLWDWLLGGDGIEGMKSEIYL